MRYFRQNVRSPGNTRAKISKYQIDSVISKCLHLFWNKTSPESGVIRGKQDGISQLLTGKKSITYR